MGKYWDKWRKPAAGEKYRLRQSPQLDPIDENFPSPSFHDIHTKTWHQPWELIDMFATANWASGDARNFEPTNDEWNDSSASSNNWTNGGDADNHGFSGDNEFGAAKAGDDAQEGNAGGASGACFNCGSGQYPESSFSCADANFACRLSPEEGLH